MVDSATTNSDPADREVERLPALIIGVGGTGLMVLKFIRALAYEGVDPHLRQALEKCRIVLLGIDADRHANEEEGVDPAIYATTDGGLSDRLGQVSVLRPIDDYFPIDAAAMVQAAERIEADAYRRAQAGSAGADEPLTYPEFDRWYPFVESGEPSRIAMVAARSGGAQQWRPLGRLGLVRQAGELSGKLRGLISEIRAHHQPQRAEAHVFVVSSLAGGTGSGMFLDIAMLARMADDELAIRGVFILPDVFDGAPATDRILPNGYAALMELVAYANWAGIERDFVVEYPGAGEFKATPVSVPLFDGVHLFGAFRPRECTSLDPVKLRIQATAFRVAQNILTWLRRDVRGASRHVFQNGRTPISRGATHDERKSVFSTSATTLFPYVDFKRVSEIVGDRLAKTFEKDLDRTRLSTLGETIGRWEPDGYGRDAFGDLPVVLAVPLAARVRALILKRRSAGLTPSSAPETAQSGTPVAVEMTRNARFVPWKVGELVSVMRKHASELEGKPMTLDGVRRQFELLTEQVVRILGVEHALPRLCRELAEVEWIDPQGDDDGLKEKQSAQIRRALDNFVGGPLAAHGIDIGLVYEQLVEDLGKIESNLHTALLAVEAEEVIRVSLGALGNLPSVPHADDVRSLEPATAVWWLAEHIDARKPMFPEVFWRNEARPGFETRQYQDLVNKIADRVMERYETDNKGIVAFTHLWLDQSGRADQLRQKLQTILDINERNKRVLTLFQGMLRVGRKEHAPAIALDLPGTSNGQRLEQYEKLFENISAILSGEANGNLGARLANSQADDGKAQELWSLRLQLAERTTWRSDLAFGGASELSERRKQDLRGAWAGAFRAFMRIDGNQQQKSLSGRLRYALWPLFGVESPRILECLTTIDRSHSAEVEGWSTASGEGANRSRHLEVLRRDSRLENFKNQLLRLAFGTAERFVGIWAEDEFLIRSRYGRGDALRRLVRDSHSDVFREGRVLNTLSRRHLVIVPPPDLGKDSPKKESFRLMRQELRLAAQSEMNVSPTYADASAAPVVFHEDLFHPGADVHSIRRLHESYMSLSPAERRLYHIRRQNARLLEPLIRSYHLGSPVLCGNVSCSYDIRFLHRGTLVCPACHNPIWNRCGNVKCQSDNVHGQLVKTLGESRLQTASTCPACGGPLHTYWWHCSDPAHETFSIAMDKHYCPHCVEERQSGARRERAVRRRPAGAGVRCPGCGDHGDATTDIPASLEYHYRNGVNGRGRVTFDPTVTALQRDPHVCPSHHPRRHFTFPTCPRDAADKGGRHHLYRGPGERWQCGQHADIEFYECFECSYPIEYNRDDIEAERKKTCPRCLSTVTFCFSCSWRDHQLFPPTGDGECGESTCPRCLNPMDRTPSLRPAANAAGPNRCFCPNVFGCAAAAEPWRRQTDDRARYCEACVYEPRGKLAPAVSLLPTVERCDICKFLVGIGERNGTHRVTTKHPLLDERGPPASLEQSSPANKLGGANDDGTDTCQICSFLRGKVSKFVSAARVGTEDENCFRFAIEVLKHIVGTRDNTTIRDALAKTSIARTRAEFAKIEFSLEPLFDHEHPSGRVLCDRLKGIAAAFDLWP